MAHLSTLNEHNTVQNLFSIAFLTLCILLSKKTGFHHCLNKHAQIRNIVFNLTNHAIFGTLIRPEFICLPVLQLFLKHTKTLWRWFDNMNPNHLTLGI